MKIMIKRIVTELGHHAPYTAVGAFSGIIVMAIIVITNVPPHISEVAFCIFHPLHVLLSAFTTVAMYRRHSSGKLWFGLLVGYTGSIGVATLSDSVMPYLGGLLLGTEMEFHIGFIQEWWLVNPLAIIGMALGYLRPATKLPHAGHVLLSTWASLFYFVAFGVTTWIPVLYLVFLFLFLSVWLPCCLSDIVYPLLFVGGTKAEYDHVHHGH